MGNKNQRCALAVLLSWMEWQKEQKTKNSKKKQEGILRRTKSRKRKGKTLELLHNVCCFCQRNDTPVVPQCVEWRKNSKC